MLGCIPSTSEYSKLCGQYSANGAGTYVVQSKSAPRTLDQWESMLALNAAALDPTYVAAAAKRNGKDFTSSFIVPLEMGTVEGVGATPFCVCGKEGTQRCSRCKVAFYCSAACQRGDWATHKLTCVAPEASGQFIDANVITTGGILVSPSMRGTTRNIGSAPTADPSLPIKAADGTSFVIKVQVPLGGISAFPWILVYDESYVVHRQISPPDIAGDGFMRLVKLVQERGLNGNKAYLSASVRDGGGTLRIFIDNVLPVMSW